MNKSMRNSTIEYANQTNNSLNKHNQEATWKPISNNKIKNTKKQSNNEIYKGVYTENKNGIDKQCQPLCPHEFT